MSDPKSFTLKKLPPDTEVLRRAFRVCSAVFPSVSETVFRTNFLESHGESFLVGAHDGDEIVAVNGFIGHDVLVAGKASTAYQSCWSATDPRFTGRGLFRSIIEFAIAELRGKAAFMFGFPNAVSEPIFLSKLGFQRTAMRRAVLSTRGPASLLQQQFRSSIIEDMLSNHDIVRFDTVSNFRWKSAERGDVVSVEHYGNQLWGKTQKRTIFGRSVTGMIAGGLEINRPQLIGHLLRQARRDLGVSFVRFLAAEGSIVATAARIPLTSRSEPFIHRVIDGPERMRFDAHVGLKDAY